MSKTYLSIGAGPGIGLATAKRFARSGFDVVLASRDRNRLQALAGQVEASGGRVRIEAVNAFEPQAVADLVRSVGPDVVHYNAGVLHYDGDGKLMTRTITDESVASLASDTKAFRRPSDAERRQGRHPGDGPGAVSR